MSKRRISLQDIKQALLDNRFRSTLPETLEEDVTKFLNNPTCACNHKIYRNVMKYASKQLTEYFPTKENDVEEIEKSIDKLSKNDWQVINCNVHDLQAELRNLGPGRKQLDIARFEDQVTIVVNHLEGIF